MYPPPQRTSIGVILGIVIGAGLVGAVFGSLITYGVMTSLYGRVSSTTKVPASHGFGKQSGTHQPDGWWKYSFPDLDISVELPCSVWPYTRSFPGTSGSNISQTANYEGFTPEASLMVGAFWERETRLKDPMSAMQYNMDRPEAKRPGLEYTLSSKSIDGAPASILMGTFTERGRQAGIRMIYIVHGNGLYHIEYTFWTSEQPQGDKSWNRMLSSLHFLGRAALDR